MIHFTVTTGVLLFRCAIIFLICSSFVSIQVDMVTPMCSQLTYEGLLDEVGYSPSWLKFMSMFSVNHGKVIIEL